MQHLTRNFSIIAHIDHGKSTVADRLLETAGVTDARSQKEQILDNMDLERERGITIKSNAITFSYAIPQNFPISESIAINDQYRMNLIDTPGHIDFNYEVSRSLAACEGCLLIVDASQGIQAQTMANFHHAKKANLTVIPVINKIDLPNADIEKTEELIENTLLLERSSIVRISAKTGKNILELFAQIIVQIPAPSGLLDSPMRALVFDSYYDSYVGVVVKVRVVDGHLKRGDHVCFMKGQKNFLATEIGIMRLTKEPVLELSTGDVGYIVTGLKDLEEAQVGDTVTHMEEPAEKAFAGYDPPQPMVFSSLYAVDGNDFPEFQNGLKKMKLNDSALTFEREQSPILGFGFRVGYLGLLHMEIIRERLLREFQLNLIATVPSVQYHVRLTNQELKKISNPAHWPAANQIDSVQEPIALVTIFCLSVHVGSILQLLQDKRGEQKEMEYLNSEGSMKLLYTVPFAEIIHDFYDPLKSMSEGYASLNYTHHDYLDSDLIKLQILVNGEVLDSLSPIVHRKNAYARAKQVLHKLKEAVPRQQFQIILQAAIGSKVIAREDISAFRKSVTDKCYGGDITRKRKLLEKQKAGKRKMKQRGQFHIPQKVFLGMLKNSNSS